MIKIRYLLAVLIILFVAYIWKNKSKLRISETVSAIIISLILVIMPFENLFIKFDSPQDAFRYAVNGTIIRTVEQENTALIIYGNESAMKTSLISLDGEKWKNPFLPVRQKLLRAEDCMPNLYEVATPVMITYERKGNNAYILVSPPYDDVRISDNMGSVFEEFSVSDIRTHFFAYVEDFNQNYILNINGTDYPILQKTSRT